MNKFALPTNSIAELSAIVLASTKPDILTVAAEGAFLMPVLCSFAIPLGMSVPESFIDFKTGISNCDNRGVSLVATAVGETPFIVASDNLVAPKLSKFAAHALTDISAETIKRNSFFIFVYNLITLMGDSFSVRPFQNLPSHLLTILSLYSK